MVRVTLAHIKFIERRLLSTLIVLIVDQGKWDFHVKLGQIKYKRSSIIYATPGTAINPSLMCPSSAKYRATHSIPLTTASANRGSRTSTTKPNNV